MPTHSPSPCSTGTVECTSVEEGTRAIFQRQKQAMEAALSNAPLPRAVCVTGEPIRRTLKLLMAVARGDWVVGKKWLESWDASTLEEHELSAPLPGCRVARLQGGRALHGLHVVIVSNLLGTPGLKAFDLEVLMVAAGATVEVRRGQPTKRCRPTELLTCREAAVEAWRNGVLLDLEDAKESLLDGIMHGRFRHAVARAPHRCQAEDEAENERPTAARSSRGECGAEEAPEGNGGEGCGREGAVAECQLTPRRLAALTAGGGVNKLPQRPPLPPPPPKPAVEAAAPASEWDSSRGSGEASGEGSGSGEASGGVSSRGVAPPPPKRTRRSSASAGAIEYVALP